MSDAGMRAALVQFEGFCSALAARIRIAEGQIDALRRENGALHTRIKLLGDGVAELRAAPKAATNLVPKPVRGISACPVTREHLDDYRRAHGLRPDATLKIINQHRAAHGREPFVVQA